MRFLSPNPPSFSSLKNPKTLHEMSKKKINVNKPSQTTPKVNPYYTISYTNIRGLSGNKPDVATHLQQVKPDFMSICETFDLSNVEVEKDYKFDGYDSPIKKMTTWVDSPMAFSCMSKMVSLVIGILLLRIPSYHTCVSE